MAIVTVFAVGVGAGVGVGLGVGGGFSMTNKGGGIGRAAVSLNVGEANTVMAPATSTSSVIRKRMVARITYYPNKLWNLSAIVAASQPVPWKRAFSVTYHTGYLADPIRSQSWPKSLESWETKGPAEDTHRYRSQSGRRLAAAGRATI